MYNLLNEQDYGMLCTIISIAFVMLFLGFYRLHSLASTIKFFTINRSVIYLVFTIGAQHNKLNETILKF